MIVLWIQAVAVAAWLAFFAVSGREFVTPGRAWPAVAASAALVAGMNALLARASARGDISVAGTVSLSGGAGRRVRTLFARRDALDALGAAILLGFVAAVDRWGALAMGPPSYLLCSHGATATLSAAALALSVAPRALYASVRPASALALLGHGLLGVTGTGMQTTALTSAPAAYVNAIRRMSALVAVVLGATMFREPDLPRRLAAAGLACAGAACLLFAR